MLTLGSLGSLRLLCGRWTKGGKHENKEIREVATENVQARDNDVCSGLSKFAEIHQKWLKSGNI